MQGPDPEHKGATVSFMQEIRTHFTTVVGAGVEEAALADGVMAPA